MCNDRCQQAKRDGARRGGTTTATRYGRAHMQKIGRSGFHGLALRLGDGHANYPAAIFVLASRGQFQPHTALPTRPWRGTR